MGSHFKNSNGSVPHLFHNRSIKGDKVCEEVLKCTIMYCVNYWQETRPGLLYYIVSRVVPNHASTALRRVTSSFFFCSLTCCVDVREEQSFIKLSI